GDHRALAIGEPLGHGMTGGLDAIVDIDDAPFAFEPAAIGAAIPGAAAVIDVEHGNAAAGPVLNAQIQDRTRRGGWTAMAFDDKRRLLAGWRRIVGVLWRIVIAVRGEPVLCRKHEVLR